MSARRVREEGVCGEEGALCCARAGQQTHALVPARAPPLPLTQQPLPLPFPPHTHTPTQARLLPTWCARACAWRWPCSARGRLTTPQQLCLCLTRREGGPAGWIQRRGALASAAPEQPPSSSSPPHPTPPSACVCTPPPHPLPLLQPRVHCFAPPCMDPPPLSSHPFSPSIRVSPSCLPLPAPAAMPPCPRCCCHSCAVSPPPHTHTEQLSHPCVRL